MYNINVWKETLPKPQCDMRQMHKKKNSTLQDIHALRYKKCLNFVWCIKCDKMLLACSRFMCNNMECGEKLNIFIIPTE